MIELLKRAFTTRYVGMLEGEVARLRMENRALMNSILGIAGVPPVIVADLAEAEALRLKVGDGGAPGAELRRALAPISMNYH